MSTNKIWLKNYPPGVPHTLEYPNKSLRDILKNSAVEFPEKTAIIMDGKSFSSVTRITYKELDEYASNFAKNLYKLGIRQGDRVTLYLPNFPDYIIAFFGIQYLGAIAVPLNSLYSAHELEYHLGDSG